MKKGKRLSFQSTHPHGVRLLTIPSDSMYVEFQSTHPHGVRHILLVAPIANRMFQSTHPHGVRLSKTQRGLFCKMFQSTHPHGVRLLVDPFNVHNRGFNPRTHTGCDDLLIYGASDDLIVSIHAPTRGATPETTAIHGITTVSIHAPTRGATAENLLQH